MLKIFLFVISIIFITSCEQHKKENNITKAIDTIIAIKQKDTVKEKLNGTIAKTILTEKIAKQTLYAYFKRKGFLIQSEIEGHSDIVDLPKNKNKNIIDFFELFLYDNNHSGIISYYNIKPFQSGNCIQPYHALIKTGGNGYQILNESFIPTNISIDSISANVVYGYEYNCATKENGKAYKLVLE
jgi:hypothetical protein